MDIVSGVSRMAGATKLMERPQPFVFIRVHWWLSRLSVVPGRVMPVQPALKFGAQASHEHSA